MQVENQDHPFAKYIQSEMGKVVLDPAVSKIGLDTIELFVHLLGFDPTTIAEVVSFALSEPQSTLGIYLGEGNKVKINILPRDFFTYEYKGVAIKEFVSLVVEVFKKNPGDLTQQDKDILIKFLPFFDEVNANPESIHFFRLVLTLFHELLHSIVNHLIIHQVRESLKIPDNFSAKLDVKIQVWSESPTVQKKLEIFYQRYLDLEKRGRPYSEFQKLNIEIITFYMQDLKLSENEQAFLLFEKYINGIEEVLHRISELIIYHWLSNSRIESVTNKLIGRKPGMKEIHLGYSFSLECMIPNEELILETSRYESEFEEQNTAELLRILKERIAPLFTSQEFNAFIEQNFQTQMPELVKDAQRISWEEIASKAEQFFKDLYEFLLPYVQERELSGKCRKEINSFLGHLNWSRQTRAEFTWFHTDKYEKRNRPANYRELLSMNETVQKAVIEFTDKKLSQGLSDRELSDHLFSNYLNGLCDLLWHAVLKMYSLQHEEEGNLQTTYFRNWGEFIDSEEVFDKHWWKHYLPPSLDLVQSLQAADTPEKVRLFITLELLPAVTDIQKYQERIKNIIKDNPNLMSEHQEFLNRYKKLFVEFVKKVGSNILH